MFSSLGISDWMYAAALVAAIVLATISFAVAARSNGRRKAMLVQMEGRMAETQRMAEDLQKVRQTMASAQENLNALNTKLEAATQREHQALADRDTFQSEMSRLHEKLNVAEAQARHNVLAAHQSAQAEATQQIGLSQEALQTALAETERLRVQLETLEKQPKADWLETEKLRSDVQLWQGRCAKLEAECANHEHEMALARNQNLDQERRLAEAQADILHFQGVIRQREQEVLRVAAQASDNHPEAAFAENRPPAGSTDDLKSELSARNQQLIMQGKMASLGHLVAGIAHEINTPIGAINASHQNLTKNLGDTLRELSPFLRRIEPTLVEPFFGLVDRSAHSGPSLSSREERLHRKSLGEALANYGVQNADNMAKTLIRVGIYDNLEPFADLLRHPDAETYIEMAAKAGRLHFNLSNIGLALQKVMKMLLAVKNYARKSADDHPEVIDLTENLETVLTIYHNQLKYGVEVHTKFPDVAPSIEAYPDQLTQVWTNILHNAIQAMDGKGEFWLEAEHTPDGKFIQVRMIDNGPGIPPEIQEKIFQPFFTTKKAGQGTGLGLDICKQIVQKHGGRIEVESEPGRTCFIVTLPTQPQLAEVEA